jgi:hypothetical protein
MVITVGQQQRTARHCARIGLALVCGTSLTVVEEVATADECLFELGFAKIEWRLIVRMERAEIEGDLAGIDCLAVINGADIPLRVRGAEQSETIDDDMPI